MTFHRIGEQRLLQLRTVLEQLLDNLEPELAMRLTQITNP